MHVTGIVTHSRPVPHAINPCHVSCCIRHIQHPQYYKITDRWH